MEIKTNKFNIYLIKEKFLDEDSITNLDIDSSIIRIVLDDIGIFYYRRSFSNPPDWLGSFFNNHESIDPSHFFGAGTKAVLIVKLSHRNKDRFFAIPFGSGRFLLKDLCCEERFGLVTSLNILESKGIRGLDKRTLTTNPKSSREQVARASEAIDFQIDYERDLVQSITGKSVDSQFGNTITGKEALSVSTKVDITNIKVFLKKVLSTYEKKDYQKNFKWIDQITEVKIPATLDKLNDKLLDKLMAKDDLVWLAVPEIIDWADVAGFKYSLRKRDILYDELELETFFAETELEEISVEILSDHFISCWSAKDDDYLYKWNVFSCLNAEIDLRGRKFFLANGKWYEIAADFVSTVNKAYEEIAHIDLKLPQYNHKTEGEYNKAAATAIKALCLDANNIQYGGGHSKIEFCDLLTKDKNIIHVKKYGGSALLSHLFSQGFTSAELLVSDPEFREEVIKKLTTDFKAIIPASKPTASEYKIVYAIITTQKKKLTIPFFSKVVLKNNNKILSAYGFTVCLCKIQNIKSEKEED